MIRIRRSADRGYADFGWLKSRHTFSFANYHDDKHMGFGPLRVINEDRVEPGRGFGQHSHQNMEILSWVLDGALAHKDSIGTGAIIVPGEMQRMTAGTGIAHSEFNNSSKEPVHFLQIWILPATSGLKPGYEQRSFSAKLDGNLFLVASADGRDGYGRPGWHDGPARPHSWAGPSPGSAPGGGRPPSRRAGVGSPRTPGPGTGPRARARAGPPSRRWSPR